MADDVTLKLGGDAKALVEALKQGGDAFGAFVSKASQQSAELNTRVRELTDVKALTGANAYAKAVQAIGGASKLTADEKARLNTILTQALEKYRVLGLQAPDDLKKLAAETTAVEKKTSLLDGTIGKLTASFTAANLIDRAIGALGRWGAEAIATAGTTVDLSNRTGLTTETIQRMSFAADQTGGSLAGLSQAAYQLGIRIATGTGSTREGVAALGLEYQKLRDLSPDEQFALVMRALEGIEDPQQRNTIAVRLFGSAAKDATQAAADGYSKVAAQASVTADAQIRAIDEAADAWDKFLADLGKGFQSTMGAIVVATQQLGTGIENLTAQERQHIAFLRKSGGDVDAYLEQVRRAHAAAADEQARKAKEAKDAAAVERDYSSAILEAREAVAGLTAQQRQQFITAERVGATTEELTDQFGLNAIAQQMLREEIEQKKNADKEAADEAKKRAETEKNAYEDMFGIAAQKKALEMAARLGDVSNVAKLTTAQKEALRKAVLEALEAYDKLGQQVPPKLRVIEAATRPLLVTTRQWAAVELKGAVQAMTPFAASVRNLGVDAVPLLSASIHKSRLGFVELKPAVADSAEEIEDARERIEKMRQALDAFVGESLGALAAGLYELSTMSRGTWGDVAHGLSQVTGSLQYVQQNWKGGWQNSAFGQIAQGGKAAAASYLQLGGALASGIPEMNRATQSASKASRVLGGMATGMKMGMAIAGPYGAVVGAAVGAIVGAVRKPEHAEIMKDVGRDWGVKISEELAKKIQATAKELFRKDRVAASIFNMDAIIQEAGGLNSANYNKFLAQLRNVFVMVGVGKFTVEQGREVLDKNFGAFAAQLQQSGQIASKAFLEILALNKQYGTQSQAVAQFVLQQTARAGAGLAGMLAPLEQQYGGLAAKIAEAQERLAEFVADGRTNTDEYAAALKELNALIALQATGAASAHETIERTGRLTLATFNAAIANGASWPDALAGVTPALDRILALQKDLGIESTNAALQELVRYRNLQQQHAALIEQAMSLNETMLAMSNIGALNAETLADMEAQGHQTYEQLIAAGFTETEALRMQRDWLRNVIKAHEDLGIPIDENTLKMIEQARQQKILSDEELSTNEILMEGLRALIEAVGGELPKAWRRAADAAADYADDASHAANQRVPTSGGDGSVPAFAIGSKRATGSWFLRNVPAGGMLARLDPNEAVVPRGQTMEFITDQLIAMRGLVMPAPASSSPPAAGAAGGAGGGDWTVSIGDVHITARDGATGRDLAYDFIDTLRRDPVVREKLTVLVTGGSRGAHYA